MGRVDRARGVDLAQGAYAVTEALYIALLAIIANLTAPLPEADRLTKRALEMMERAAR